MPSRPRLNNSVTESRLDEILATSDAFLANTAPKHNKQLSCVRPLKQSHKYQNKNNNLYMLKQTNTLVAAVGYFYHQAACKVHQV